MKLAAHPEAQTGRLGLKVETTLLLPLLQQFAATLTANFAAPAAAQPEDQLKTPVNNLLTSAGGMFRLGAVVARAEAHAESGGRPDFAIVVGGLLCGYIELKAPGVGARPQSFRANEHNGKQWQKFKLLPNLIYTDGNQWTLFRDGAQVGQTVRFTGDVTINGAAAVTQADADALETLLRDFLNWNPIIPSRPRELARLLAPLCRFIRTDVETAIADENSGLAMLAREWRSALFPDADNAKFADAYAQTLTYSLLLARVEGRINLTLDNAAGALDANHGLLAEALRVLGHPNARREIGAGLDVLLRIVNALEPDDWRNAGQGNGEDPWLYFYEDFLAEYDRRLRNDAGVYYTPVAVVKAQVRLVEELLRTRFGKQRGFNAAGVTVLDPAAGTGAYPLAVLEHAITAARDRGGPGAVAGAATDLASRLHGFEFLVGPYAVAHLRLTQAVRAAGGHLPASGANVYLCDTLESPSAPAQQNFFTQRLAEEHERARRVKQETPVLVCLGNPPYDRQQRDDLSQVLRGGWIRWGEGAVGSPVNAPLETFLAPARAAGFGRHIKNLYNDYVYFWRWALWKTFEHRIPGNEVGGIVCFITASSYLRGPGFVGMRRVMRETFDELWILDLEGDNRGARPTENVFNIQTGVAIAIGVRTGLGDQNTPSRVRYAKLTGTRADKFAALERVTSLGDVTWKDCPDTWGKPLLPLTDAAYWDWPELTDLFPWQHSGVQLKRTWPIGETVELIQQRWRRLVAASAAERATLFRQTPSRNVTSTYRDERTQERLPAIGTLRFDAAPPTAIRYGFRSFDRQWTFDDVRMSDRFRIPLWMSLGPRQVYLTSLLTGVLGDGPAAVVTPYVPDLHHFRNSFGGKDAIPLWRDAAATQANVTGRLLDVLSGIYGEAVGAPGLFAYCYALLSPRAYVATFADELLLPGPRIPLTRSIDLFRRVAAHGHELIRCHTFGERDLEADAPTGEVTPGTARCTIAVSPDPAQYPEDYAYNAETQTLRVGVGEFAPVALEVWEYSVSGLQVVRSWLGYRMKEPTGRTSSPLDNIRPQSWTAAMTEELLEVLWTLERTLALEPVGTDLLQQVLQSELVLASELPQPTETEREPPGDEEPEQGRLAL